MVGKGRVTATEVARRSGVSQATVSYVLNNTPTQKISDGTRARVLAAADELGYTPFEPARVLRSGRSSLVLFVCPDFPVGHVAGRLFELLTSLLTEQGRTMLTHRVSPDVALVDVARAVAPDAVISMVPVTDAERAALRRLGTSLEIIAFGEERDLTGAHVVHPLEKIGRMQATHLLEAGHRRLGYGLPDEERSALFYLPRLAGVRKACEEAGLSPPSVRVVPAERTGAAEVVTAWRAERITALCAYNDDVAIAVLGGARATGTEVPADLAVVGVDDIPLADLVTPRLTSIHLAVDTMARELARPLAGDAGHFDTGAAVDVEESRIVVRESA